jgi:hypothetical protein
MCKWQKVIPRHKGSPRYRIAHGWKDEFGSLILKLLKFLMHLENLRVHFLLFFIHTHIFFLMHLENQTNEFSEDFLAKFQDI